MQGVERARKGRGGNKLYLNKETQGKEVKEMRIKAPGSMYRGTRCIYKAKGKEEKMM